MPADEQPRDLHQKLIPTDGSASELALHRDTRGLTGAWMVRTTLPFDAFVDWAAAQLRPEFTPGVRSKEMASFHRVETGDAYALTITDRAPHGYELTFVARPF